MPEEVPNTCIKNSNLTGVFEAPSFGEAQRQRSVDVDLGVKMKSEFPPVWRERPVELDPAVRIQGHVVGKRTAVRVFRRREQFRGRRIGRRSRSGAAGV